MTIRRSAAVAAVAAALLVPVQAQRETRQRTINVSVVSRDGAPLTGLTAKDFVVRENGLAREVVGVAAAPPPAQVAILLDDSQATQNTTTFLRPAMTGFLKTMAAASPAPQFALWTFGERPTRRVNFTPNAETVEKAVLQIFPVNGSGAYFLEAIGEAVRELRTRKAEGAAIVAFVAERGPEFSSVLEKQVTEGLRSVGASLWVVTLQVSGQPLNTTEARERARVLGDTTLQSGGVNDVILTPQALESAFGRIAAQLTHRYAVTYGRPESLIPPDRVEVEVKRPDADVRVSRWAGR
jgi:hypothetical protein